MESYFDNSATTRCCEAAKDIMVKVLTEDFGNPSSMHMKGVEAEKYVKTATKQIASTLRCQEKEIIFTSGGTESNNMAIIGSALANRRAGKHLITTSVEHAAVKNVMSFLESEGFEISYLSVNEYGEISLDELKNTLRDDTILVSIMMVNNEVGALEPVAEAGKIIHAHNKDCIFHVDAIQAYGKFRIIPKNMDIDLLSVSGHKIHGPKGVGFLYIKDKTKIKPIIFGGGQQRDMRSGTINVPGIAGLGMAAEHVYTDFDAKIDKLYELKAYLAEELLKIDDVVINSRLDRNAAPHILSASFLGVRSEVLLHSLEDRYVYVSAGSACSSHHPSKANTLASIGLSAEAAESTIRMSLCENSTKEEIDYAVGVIKELLPMLRRYRRH